MSSATPQQPVEDRYTRVRQLGWDVDLLKRSTILVVGAGALGNEIIKDLALAGIGRLIIVDMDTIETHNLTRAVLFRGSDVGRGKAQAAAEAAADIEPNIATSWFETPLHTTLGLGVFRNADVVLGGVDNLQTRRDINRACMQAGTPFIDGGLFYLDGDVRTFLPPFNVCFDCTLTGEERDEGWRRWSCLKLGSADDAPIGPTAPTISAMIGGLQAQLAIKYLHLGREVPYPVTVPDGVRIRFNGFADEYERWNLSRDADCPTHMEMVPVREEHIVSLSSGNDMSAESLLAETQTHLGPEAYVELGFDVIHSLVCMECGGREPSMQRVGALQMSEAVCPQCTPSSCGGCGAPIRRIFESRPDLVFPDRVDCPDCFASIRLVIRDTETLNRIEPGSPALSHTLSELGVPLMDILEAKAYEAEHSLFFQLDGDRERVYSRRD